MYQNGTIIGQKYNRLSSRAYLEYRVSDRLKFTSELSYSYSSNQRSYVFDFGNNESPNEDLSLLGIAYKKMPNVSVYKQDALGNNTSDFYNVLSNSRLNPDQKYLVNPLAMAHLAKNEVKNYRVLPTFRLLS